MRVYTASAFEALFSEDTSGADAKALRHGRVSGYRTRTIRAGRMLEVEAYPILGHWEDARGARERKGKTPEAQQVVNARNAEKRLIRRLNASFTEKDLVLTITYRGAVPDEAGARRNMQNYIRRVKGWRRRHGLGEMMYAYVIEFDDGAGTRKRGHYHLVMSGMDRDAAEGLWRDGGRVETRWLQPDENGLEGLGRYMLKASRGSRRCVCSRNIKEPVVTVSDRKIGRRTVERLAAQLEWDAKDVLEKVYPGYGFVGVEVKRSDYLPGAWVYGKMRRAGGREIKEELV